MFQVGTFASQTFSGIMWLLICFVIVFVLPNTQEFVFQSAKNDFNKLNMIRKRKNIINLKWKPNMPWLIAILILFVSSILSLNKKSEFIYLQF